MQALQDKTKLKRHKLFYIPYLEVPQTRLDLEMDLKNRLFSTGFDIHDEMHDFLFFIIFYSLITLVFLL